MLKSKNKENNKINRQYSKYAQSLQKTISSNSRIGNKKLDRHFQKSPKAVNKLPKKIDHNKKIIPKLKLGKENLK